MCYLEDLCASATSASSPTGIALNWSPVLSAVSNSSKSPETHLQSCTILQSCTTAPNVAVSQMWRSHGLIGTAHPGSVATPFPSLASHRAIMKRSFSTRLFHTLWGGRLRCARAQTQRHFPHELLVCSRPCFIHFATPTPPTCCFSSASIRL